jgi:hypothetical protein
LRHLFPIINSSSLFNLSQKGGLIGKVLTNLDFYLPFRQHAPSLKNARSEIYADLHSQDCEDGVAFFNILAFRGVFFGSPFSQSDHFQRFESYEHWTVFRKKEKQEALDVCGLEEKYYVKQNCYGQSQLERSLTLLEGYWAQRKSWNEKFGQSTPPTVDEVYYWLVSKENGRSKFYNIGPLSAFLICGDLIEADIVPMPSSYELGKLIYKVGMGGKKGMEGLKLVSKGDMEGFFCKAFALLDAYIEKTLGVEEKKAMGYNVVMLEHTLCKIQRLTALKAFENIFTQI